MTVTCTSSLALVPQVSGAQLETALLRVSESSSKSIILPQDVSEAQLEVALRDVQKALNPNEELLRELDNILKNKPDQVRRTIHHIISQELQRSYHNVADQVRSFKTGLEKFVALETSEDMRNLRQMLQQLKDSDLRALEREASNIDKLSNDMVRCIQEQDFGSLKQIARCLENSSNRFIDKYSNLSTLLRKLAEHCEELQRFFADGKEKSYSLAKETAERQEKWFSMFGGISVATGVLSAGILVASVHTCIVTVMAMNAAGVKAKLVQGAATTASVKAKAAQQAAQAAHVPIWKSLLQGSAAGAGAAGGSFALASFAHIFAVPVAIGVGATVATIVSSKDIITSKAAYTAASTKASAAAKAAALSQAAAASAAQTAAVTASSGAATIAVFQPMAITSGVVVALFLLGCAGRDKMKTLLATLWKKEIELHLQTAEAFKAIEQHLREVAEQLHSTEEDNTKLLEALELVRETAQEMAERADDAEQVSPPAGPQAERTLQRHVDELTNLVDTLREQTVLLLPAVIEMQSNLEAQNPKFLPGIFPLSDGYVSNDLTVDHHVPESAQQLPAPSAPTQEELQTPVPIAIDTPDASAADDAQVDTSSSTELPELLIMYRPESDGDSVAMPLASSSDVNSVDTLLNSALEIVAPASLTAAQTTSEPESDAAIGTGARSSNNDQNWEVLSGVDGSEPSFRTELSEVVTVSHAESETSDKDSSWILMSSARGSGDNSDA